MDEEDLRKAVQISIKAGYQISKEAFDFLKSLPKTVNVEELMDNVLRRIEEGGEKPTFIDIDLIEDESRKILRRIMEEREGPVESVSFKFKPFAKEVEADIKVIRDPTDEIKTTGSLEDFIEYFRDRFSRMRDLFKQRIDSKDSVPISHILKLPNNTRAKVICMIIEKRETRRGIFLSVEDLEESATIYVPADREGDVIEKARSLPLDIVVCISVVKGRNNLLVAEDIIFPDIPNRKPNKASIPVYAALTSDLHIGSKMFMEKEFRQFILWLKGKRGNRRLREIAGHIKYLIIAGDIVDGVGIYPQQINELYIKDIYRQYEAAAEILEDLPEYIEVIVIPGNHDAIRRALPQPAIPKKYAEPLYESRKVYSLGNPSVISLHQVKLLLYHGRSLDDIISSVPKMKFQEPDNAMKFLLKCRHLAPTYGQRTPIASERRDHLIIEHVPDLFHAGHVHLMRYSSYRGTVIVNSGAWQGQTEYQREMGHVPNPGIVPVINLQTLNVSAFNFRESF